MVLFCRFNLYLGAQTRNDVVPDIDTKPGPEAVVRIMARVLEGAPEKWRVIVVDRYYSSVALFIQLLSMKVCAVGTVVPKRIGYCEQIVDKSKQRYKNTPRGVFKMSRSEDVPVMSALSWLDNRPVHFLATGAAMCASTVHRLHGFAIDAVPCPKLVRDYHDLMGGVDRHDQLQL